MNKNMKWYQKSVNAWIIFIVVALVSSLVSGTRQLKSKLSAMENQFYNGTYQDGLSVYYDLNKIEEVSLNLLSVCEKNQLNYEWKEKLNNLTLTFESIKSISEYSDWFKEAKRLLPLAFSDLSQADLTDKYKKMVTGYEAAYKSACRTIEYDDLNRMIKDYQKETTGILGSFFNKLTFVEEIDDFE